MKITIVFFLLISSLNSYSQDAMKNDWANLNKYAAENKEVKSITLGQHPIVYMGDSITEFWKVLDGDFFASNPFLDRGISGQTTPQMLLRFRQDVINLNPSKVVVLAGINDIAENTGPITLEAIFGNIVSMVELANANKIKVILCSVLPANKFPWRPYLAPAEKVIRLNKMIKAYALKNKIDYVDYYKVMVDSEKGLPTKYSDDGVHPNLEGYKVMESVLAPFLK